jgi:hypothetical protein
MFAQRLLAGIQGDVEGSSAPVALAARVHQVVVFSPEFGSDRLGFEVIDPERRFSVWNPRFATQAVDTAEKELIAQPGLVGSVIHVASRSMCPSLGPIRISKRH